MMNSKMSPEMDDEADQKILQEIMNLFGSQLGSKIKPKMVSVEMSGMKPSMENDEGSPEEGSPEEEASESPRDEMAEHLGGPLQKGDPILSQGEDLNMKGLESELMEKGLEKEMEEHVSDDDDESEYGLRQKGRIF